MKYCSNCGTQLDDDCLFCIECGEKTVLEQDSVEPNKGHAKAWDFIPFSTVFDGQHEQKPSKTTIPDGYAVAYLLTDTRALSQKLGCKRTEVQQRLEQYIKIRRESGVFFILLDACDYTPCLKENKRLFSNSISLTRNDGWLQYQRLVTDRYIYDTEENKHEVDFLFIVGSDDTIPMPMVGKHVDGSSIQSDVPYAYLFGDKTEALIADYSIFHQTMHLLVGRLPFGNDATLQTLDTYISNVAALTHEGNRVPFSGIYAQTDPNWQLVTSAITNDFYSNGLLVGPFEHMGEGATFRNIRLTPPVALNNIIREYHTESAFYPCASLYMFNMHGSEHPAHPGYGGYDAETCRNYCVGLTPEYFSAIRTPNVVITEACWGAKHNNLNTNESILLSSLSNKTIAFIGSSHTAYGNVDVSFERMPELRYADVVALESAMVLSCGMPLGYMLYYAKMADFKTNGLTPHTMTTALEFNLFGDPSLTYFMQLPDGSPILSEDVEKHAKKGSKRPKGHTIIPASSPKITKVDTVYDKNENSILAITRNAVNRNLTEIREKVNKYLYENYNVSPRLLNKMLRVQYTDGTHLYTYSYCMENSNISIAVITDAKGDILNIASSK